MRGIAAMTFEDLVAEGEAIARPSFLLGSAPTDSGVVGSWGGERADEPNALPPAASAFTGRRHILSLSEDLLGALGIRQGRMSLFAWERTGRGVSYRAVADQRLRFADLNFSGSPLYTTNAISFPPFAALCLHGRDVVARWLKTQGLARHEYWRIGYDELPERYEAEWHRRSPFFSDNGPDVMVGGWPFLWPDDDFFMPPEMMFVALTRRDAEPWLEVRHSPSSLGWTVIERIT
jgi:hypothetical protein